MGGSSGPNIVNDGLVFAYDMAPNPGISRSWKGAPTVNLISNAGGDAEIERSGTSYPYFSQNITSYVLANWSASNNKLSMSFEGKRDYSVGGTGGGGDGYPRMYIYFTDWSWASSFGSGTYDWTYFTQNNITMPDPTGKTIYFAIYHMNNGNPGRSYSRNHQVEFGTFATPFVNGTRSSTTSLLDWAGGNVMTAGTNTYNSDGTFSFTGSNGTGYSLPGTNLSLNAQTIESWCYASNFQQNGFIFEKTTNGAVNTQYSLFFNNNSGSHLYYRTYGLSTTDLYLGRSSSGVVDNAWNHVVATFDGSTKRIYVNGVQKTSANVTGTITANTTGNAYVGTYGSFNGYPFNGQISTVKVYNRALTADEVAQNFTAGRSRYGL